MQNLTSLNALYRDYKEGTLSKRDLEGKIFRTILENLQDFHLFDGDEEEGIEYLCWLYPRLSSAVQHYRENGATFSTYIGALIRYSLKEYRTNQVDRYITEYAAWAAHAADLEVHSPGIEYLKEEEEEEESEPIPVEVLPLLRSKQVLLLILKSYYFVSDDFVDKIVPFIGVEKEKLMEMLENLRKRRCRRDEEIHQFQERITAQFYRCLAWEKRLKGILPGSIHYERVQERLGQARKRLTKMRERFSSVKLDATHRQIAEVMGVATGTVSSGLAMLKSHWEMDKKGRPVRRIYTKKEAGTTDS
jgi:hypothetical protein